VKCILSGLFPGIRSNTQYWTDHKLALANDRYFDRYFLFGLPENDVEDALIESALSDITLLDLFDTAAVARYKDIIDGPDDQRAALAYEKSELYRSDIPISSRSLVLFLFDRLRDPGDEGFSFDSSQRVLWRWVQFEALQALADGSLKTTEILSSLTPEITLALTIRMLRDRNGPESRTHAALQGLGDYYHERLTNDISGVLDSGLDLNSIVSTVVWLKNDLGLAKQEARQDLREVGDRLIRDDDREKLKRVIRAMVVENRWQGSDGVTPELAFNSDTLFQLFSNDSTIQLAERLPATMSVRYLNKDDTSVENRDLFARASVKSVADFIPRGS